jgi:hypothetical protein
MAQFSVNDLAFYEDGTVYNGSGSSVLVTNTIDVASIWLMHALCARIKSNSQIILVTFRESSLHLKGLKRYGIELSIVPGSRCCLIDLSKQLYKVKGSTFDHMNVDVIKRQIKSAIAPSSKPVIFIENPDYLLASGMYTTTEILELMYDLQPLLSQLFIFCNTDEPLLSAASFNTNQIMSPLANEQTFLLTQLIHQSSLVVSLRPFETGRADDVTGVLRVSRGPRKVSGSKIVEKEHLYLVNNDNVKMFH